MAKQQPLSPEKYITTKARTLPIYKCYITSRWEETQMVTVIVMRRHVNGNVTIGVYLVDLLCLGVKDTMYAFNMNELEANERFIESQFEIEEVGYELAHNIVYAGHDFALEFGIKPHKDFNVTKYILEEDSEKIPVIEIPVGDENGNPSLIVDRSYNYGPALQKLKEHAGEGNYTFVVHDEFENEFMDEDDEDDEDFDEDDIDDEDELEGDADLELIDFDILSEMELDELEEIIEDESEDISNKIIVSTEIMLRALNQEESGVLIDLNDLKETKDYKLFEKGKNQWEKSAEEAEKKLSELYFQLKEIGTNQNGLSDEDLMLKAVALLNKYISEDITGFMIVNSIPLITNLSQFNILENNFDKYTPAVQLFIATHVALRSTEPGAKYQFLLNAATVEMAYPFNRHIHGFHHKLFWLLKAIQAIHQNDKEKILYYHNLLRTSGTSGHLTLLYAAQLQNWLRGYMGLEDDEDDSLEFEMLEDDE